jgi:hypothetical protein
MTREEREQLLARYTTGELTSLERERLFTEAMNDQELFEHLFEDDALEEALSDPAVRRHIMNDAPAPAPAWPLRWRWPVLAGLAASLVLAVFLIQRQITPSADPELLASARPPVARDIEPIRSSPPDSLDFSTRPAVTLTLEAPPPPPAAFSAPVAPREKDELAENAAPQAKAAAAGRLASAEIVAETAVTVANEARALPASPAPVSGAVAAVPFQTMAQFSDPSGRWRTLLPDQHAPAGRPLRLLVTAAAPVTISLSGEPTLVLPGQPRPFALPALESGEHEIRLHWSPGMNAPPAGRFADGAAPTPRLLSVTPGAPPASAVHILRLRVE